MGAIDEVQELGPIEEKDLSAAVERAIDQARFEHGHDPYSGSLATKAGDGLRVVRDAPTEKGALIRHLQDMGEKWGPILAGRYFEADEQTAKKIEAKFEKRREAIKSKMDSLPHVEGRDRPRRDSLDFQILEKLRNGKSRTRSCANCESKIAVSYLTRIQCPVCGSDQILSKTDRERVESHKQKHDELRQKMSELQQQMRQEIAEAGKKKGQAQWLIVAICSY